MRIAAFTPGINVPSARFRVRQYIPYLAKLGIEMTEFVSYLGAYPPSEKWLRLLWGMGVLTERMPHIIQSYSYDITFLQRSFISKYVTLEYFTKTKRVLDVDDAIWFSLNNNNLSSQGELYCQNLAKLSDLIICGNTFLANKFSQWNKNIHILPTGIDTDRYYPKRTRSSLNDQIIIGWMGTSANFISLLEIETSLANILKQNSQVKLRVVADQAPNFTKIPSKQLEFIKWSTDNEIQLLQDLTIGLMPLRQNSMWDMGKCSCKMLTYMACAIPVVVSPIGMNQEILNLGNIGLGANNTTEWTDAIQYLINNPCLAEQMGQMGRKIVLDKFSLQILSVQMKKILECF